MPTLLELVTDIDYSRGVGQVLADLRRVLAGHEFVPPNQHTFAPVVMIGGGTGMPAVGRALYANGLAEFAIIANPADMSRDHATLEPRGSGAIRVATGGMNWADILGPLLYSATTEPTDPLARFLDRKVGKTRCGYFVLQALAERWGVQGAINIMGEMLGNSWQVIPATTASTEVIIHWQGQAMSQHAFLREARALGKALPEGVSLNPPSALSHEANRAIVWAKTIIVGPGDLHFSVLPNFCTIGFAAAIIGNTEAKIVLPVNLSWRFMDTPDFTVRRFLEVWDPYLPAEREVIALVNTEPVDFREIIVDDLADSDQYGRFRIVRRPMASPVLSKNGQPLHDPARFGQTLLEVIRS